MRRRLSTQSSRVQNLGDDGVLHRGMMYLKFRIDPDGMRALWDAARDIPPAVSATSASHSDDPD